MSRKFGSTKHIFVPRTGEAFLVHFGRLLCSPENLKLLDCLNFTIMFRHMQSSHSTDLQQCAYELQAVLSLDARAVESLLPLDASCEDIEQKLHEFPSMLVEMRK
ncbi:hypothetical protein MKW98_003220 [Papaver atlanticum]|uniref:Uncharacterized protein n=1 Tax=Papaver atlanticum TaxID=357466 RepID=A0AAD4SN86_9MAGN|nr:hypothetical protein MKW98_003220 [Papaver atlanticum]